MDGGIEDLFLRTFFSRIPRDVAASFTPAQLDAVKRAFGARSPGAHGLDLRFSLPLWRRSYYMVLLAGKERRSPERRVLQRLLRPLWNVANVCVVVVFLAMLASAAFTAAYIGKRALNIDVVPGVDMLPDEAIENLLR